MSYSSMYYTAKKLNHPYNDNKNNREIDGRYYIRFTSKPKGKGSAILIHHTGSTSHGDRFIILINPKEG